MKRGLVIGLGVVVIVVAVGVYMLFHSLNFLVKYEIEKVGSKVTQTDVRLDSVKIRLADGEGVLTGLRVGNPKGFESKTAFSLGQIKVVIDVKSLTSDVIVVKEIRIEKPEVTYELRTRGSNITALQNNINASLGGSEKSGQPVAEEKASAGGGPKLVIDDLYVTGGTVNVSSIGLQGKTLQAALPRIHLRGIGRKAGGASPAEVAQLILRSLTQGAGKAVSTLDLGAITDSLAGGGEAAKKVLQESAGSAENVLKQSAGDASKSLKKLFR